MGDIVDLIGVPITLYEEKSGAPMVFNPRIRVNNVTRLCFDNGYWVSAKSMKESVDFFGLGDELSLPRFIQSILNGTL